MSLTSATLAHRRWLIGYENGAVNAITRAYQKRIRALLGRLEAIEQRIADGQPITPAMEAQAARDRLRLRSTYKRIRTDITSTLQTRLDTAVETELRVSARNISAFLPDGITARAPAVDIRQLVTNPTQGISWLARIDASLIPTIQNFDAALVVAVDRGASMDDAARLVSAGINAVGKHQRAIYRIVRTEIQRVSNEAAQATYRENRDVIRAVRYLATLDDRTCKICMPLNKVVYEMDEGGFHAGIALPQHPNCRCFYAPVTYSVSEILQRRRS